MDILMRAWSYFATNILQQPAWMIGLIVLIVTYCLRNPGMMYWEALKGCHRLLILAVGSSGLVTISVRYW